MNVLYRRQLYLLLANKVLFTFSAQEFDTVFKSLTPLPELLFCPMFPLDGSANAFC
jgi:hypothetical protein